MSAFFSTGFTYSSLLYLKGGVYIAVGSLTDGPSDVVFNTNGLSAIMVLRLGKILFRDFLALYVGIFHPA